MISSMNITLAIDIILSKPSVITALCPTSKPAGDSKGNFVQSIISGTLTAISASEKLVSLAVKGSIPLLAFKNSSLFQIRQALSALKALA